MEVKYYPYQMMSDVHTSRIQEFHRFTRVNADVFLEPVKLWHFSQESLLLYVLESLDSASVICLKSQQAKLCKDMQRCLGRNVWMPLDKVYILVYYLRIQRYWDSKNSSESFPIHQNWERLIPENAGGDIPYYRLCDVRLQHWAQIVRDLSQTNAA